MPGTGHRPRSRLELRVAEIALNAGPEE